jgi:hypothetical protein
MYKRGFGQQRPWQAYMGDEKQHAISAAYRQTTLGHFYAQTRKTIYI